jgi:glycosyltransferase involved in cell wall biosynthesis
MTNVDYVIVVPVRNEAEHIQRMIESVLAQTNRPTQCIIVDDGSTDGTDLIIQEAATRYKWIQTVHREDRGSRRAGGGVMDAFYAGLELLANERWQYLVKLDGDVSFEPDYFERCFRRFAEEPRLGIAGGLICQVVGGTLSPESTGDPAFHVRGATKIYRRECWQDIGGLLRTVGWDTVDELKANMLGWSTRTLSEVKIVHHRPAGAAYGMWSNWVKNGRANYVAGYHPIFMLLKCISRVFKRPYGIAALGLWVGFCSGYTKRIWRVDDPEFLRYVRHQQARRLLGRASLWDLNPARANNI